MGAETGYLFFHIVFGFLGGVLEDCSTLKDGTDMARVPSIKQVYQLR